MDMRSRERSRRADWNERWEIHGREAAIWMAQNESSIATVYSLTHVKSAAVR